MMREREREREREDNAQREKESASVNESHKWSFAFNFHTYDHAGLGGDHTRNVYLHEITSPGHQVKACSVSVSH